MTNFIKWINSRHFISVRAALLAMVVWMTWEVTKWSFDFARTSDLPGIERAAVIAAVTAPFCALQAAVFAIYGWMGKKDATG